MFQITLLRLSFPGIKMPVTGVHCLIDPTVSMYTQARGKTPHGGQEIY